MNSFKNFLKEWGLFLLILSLLALSRIFFWSNVRVEGHSMDPTLADGEILFVVKHLPIDRFDIVVAHEEDGNKDIVKRVIGMPGDTIRYENDKLYINDKETDEPYLADYIKRFKDDKLQSTYSGKGFEGNKGTFFRSIAQKRKPSQLMSTITPTLALLFQKENTFSSEMTAWFRATAAM